MHKDELWQTYMPNGEPIDGEGWNSVLDNPEVSGSDAIVGVAVVFLYRIREGKIELLWQKRSKGIDRYPGFYDISAGGHINLGESLTEAAIRETREEIGADISAEDLQFVTMRPFNKNRFAWVYAVDWTNRADNFHFDDKEVSEVRWVKYDRNEEFRKKFAKPPLQKDELTFSCLKLWFIIHGYLQAE